MASRLLIVDDNEVNCDLLLRRVERIGYEAEATQSGQEALLRLREERFDLVLLDVMMPGMSGYEVLDAIKSDSSLSRIRVIMVSANDEIESAVKGIDLGADDYLPKPFNPTLLASRIASSLARQTAADLVREQSDRMERDLQIGREIQAGFLPQELPRADGWEVDAMFQAANEVSGDFYDSFIVNDGRIALVVADVCDKGVGAALFMALFRTLVRAKLMMEGADLSSVIESVSDYIVTNHGDSNMFATMFVGLLEPDTGQLEYVNAGHDPALLWSGGEVVALPVTSTALGLMGGMAFPSADVVLGPADTLLAYTDGVTEALDSEGRRFGLSRLLDLVIRQGGGGATATVGAVRDGVGAFAGNVRQHDDITLLAASRRGS